MEWGGIAQNAVHRIRPNTGKESGVLFKRPLEGMTLALAAAEKNSKSAAEKLDFREIIILIKVVMKIEFNLIGKNQPTEDQNYMVLADTGMSILEAFTVVYCGGKWVNMRAYGPSIIKKVIYWAELPEN